MPPAEPKAMLPAAARPPRRAAAALAGALLLSLLFAPFVAAPAAAQSGRAKTTPTMRQAVYDKLSRAQEKAESGDIDGALDQLESVSRFDKLSGYEKAQLYTAYGFVHFARDDFRASLDAYRKVLAQEGLPAGLRATTIYTVAQLLFQLGEYDEAAENLRRWIDEATNPGPEPYILLGQAYYQLERYADAVGPVERAIAIAKERGRPVDESWYSLLRLFHYELGDYAGAIDALEILVKEFPRKEYWMQLAALYGETGNERRHLAAYEVAYLQGFLEGEQEIVLLAQLLMQAGIPRRAARVLEEGIEGGAVEADAEHFRLLSQAWSLAQEDRKAIDALTRAADLSHDGELYADLAYSYANVAEWESAIESARTAVARGTDRKDRLQVLLGMAFFELSRFNEAKQAFRVALASPETRETAGRWVNYIESEERRLTEIERTLGR